MAVPTICCLNLPSSTPSSIVPSQPSKNIQIPWGSKEEKGTWRKHCFVGMACMIVSAEAGALLNGEGNWAAVAGDLQVSVEAKTLNTVKWSDRRACPPWQMNSLETIVPENLPRPFNRRISESVAHSSKISSSNRPTVSPTVKTKPGCFSM